VTTDKEGVFYFWDMLHHKVVGKHHISGNPLKEEKKDDKKEESKDKPDYRDDDDAHIGLDNLKHSRNGKFSKDNSVLHEDKHHNISVDLKNSKNESKMGRNRLTSREKTDATAISKSKKPNDFKKESTMGQLDRFKSKLGIVHYLLEITEISYIKLLAFASTDKHIRIWDMNDIHKPRIIFCLNLIKGGVHQMRFLNAYQVLVVAGYENSIPVFNITPKYYDVNVVGRLVGHVSIVTALEVMEGTSMILSADDTGCIKTWDIRSFQCYQTIEMSHKTIIGQLLSMENINKVAFIGCRVNFIEFDRSDKFSHKIEVKQLIPIKADINLATEELLVCTNSDLKFLDLNTGRIKKIYAHMIGQDSPDEISVFRMIQKNHRFLLGDPKGDIMIFGVTNGEKLVKLESHSLEVIDVKVDTYNKLLVSIGADSKILIQRERLDERKKLPIKTAFEEEDDAHDINLMSPEELIKRINKEDRASKKNLAHAKVSSMSGQPDKDAAKSTPSAGDNFEVLRSILHTHQDAETTNLALSVYHNLMASASVDNVVYIYDYEYGKLLVGVELEEKCTVTALEFINGLGVLLICANNGLCYLLSLLNRQGKQEFSLLGSINLAVKSEVTISKIDVKGKTTQNVSAKSLKDLPSPSQTKVTKHPPSFVELTARPLVFAEKIYVALSLKGDHKDLEDFRKIQTTETDNLLLNNCEVYFGLQNGFISIYQLSSFFQSSKIVKHSNTRLNYNPFRTNIEDCSTLTLTAKSLISLKQDIVDSSPSFNQYLLRSFFGHKGGLTSLSLIKVPEEYLLTTGNDKYVKVISKTGDCLAAWNVNHPLPLKWSLQVDSMQDMKNRVLFALKVIQAIFKRYYNLLYAEGKVFDLKGFLKEYQDLESPGESMAEQSGNPSQGKIFQLTEVAAVEPQKKVRVMTDEYLAKDFASDKLKDLYKQELVGPSLKQLDTKRRLLLVQQEWRDEEARSKAYLNSLAQKEDTKVRRYSVDDMEQENFGAYIEKAKKLSMNTSEHIRKINLDFKRADNSKFKEQTKKEPTKLKPVGTIVFDQAPPINRPTVKGSLATISRQNTTLPGSTIDKQLKDGKKTDFFEKAKERKLLKSTTDKAANSKQEESTDSTKERLKKEIEQCIDFTEEGRIKRMQKATREFIKEKSDFSSIVTNINEKLKRSQVKNLNSRKSSLPALKAAHLAQPYNPFQSVLPKLSKKGHSTTSSKYNFFA
jgi:WD40 repeat protein